MSREFTTNEPLQSNQLWSPDVGLLDDGQGVFNWTIYGTGGDDVHDLNAAASFQGATGIRIKTRTTDAAENDYVAIARMVDLPQSGLIVARVRLKYPTPTAVKTAYIDLKSENGATARIARLLHRPNTPATDYLDTAAANIAIPSLALAVAADQWFTMELSVDALTWNYRHAALAGIKTSLTGTGLYSSGATTTRTLTLTIYVNAIGAAPAELHISHVYLGAIPTA